MDIPGLILSADTAHLAWRPTREPGVSWFPLHLTEGSGPAGDSTVLIRMEPGHGYPPHRHLDVEEVLVLAGGYRDRLGVHRAGAYVRYEPGTSHAPIAVGDAERARGPDNPACILFAIARAGIELGT